MATHKLDVTLKGQFSYIDVFIEGYEIPLREIDNDVYYRSYTNYEIDQTLDLNVKICGYPGTNWDLKINVDDKEIFADNKPFIKKWAVFTKSIDL